jgi:hypothetical protein
MSRVGRLVRVPKEDIWLLIKAAALLAVVRCALLSLPFAATRRFLRRLSRPEPKQKGDLDFLQRVAWAVSVASWVVPGGAHCLTRALVTEVFLVRRGQPAELCFGIARDFDHDFTAHAWVESEGVVVIGGPNIDQYVRLKSHSQSGCERPLEIRVSTRRG